jgi:phage baseplate assembly protein W
MPTITLDSFSKTRTAESYTYTDLHLDLKENNILTGKGLYREPTSVDIEHDYDEAAIKNSLKNLFTTMPGQKLLNPDYGLNLAQFLFAPASTTMARMIGSRIVEGIEKYENRVSVVNVNVTVNEDLAEYKIDMTLRIPTLSNPSVVFTGILSQSGFEL